MTILQLLIKAIVEKKLKEELRNVNNEGIKALRELVDGNSDFQKHTSGENIARRFDVDPLKVDTTYHYTDIDVLKKLIDCQQLYIRDLFTTWMILWK